MRQARGRWEESSGIPWAVRRRSSWRLIMCGDGVGDGVGGLVVVMGVVVGVGVFFFGGSCGDGWFERCGRGGCVWFWWLCSLL